MEGAQRSRFEQIMVLIGLVSPVATIPQVIKVYATHSEHAVGQSLTTWACYTALSGLWVYYGIRRREAPLIVGNSLGLVIYGLVAAGILLKAGLTF